MSRKIIDKHTTIHIKGCDIGRSKRMLNLIDKIFRGMGTVVAPTHRQTYGPKRGKGTPYEAFSGYFIERRGKVRLRRVGLLAAFRRKYPHLKARWLRKMLRKVKRRETSRTAFTLKLFLPTKRQARRRSVMKRFFPPPGPRQAGTRRGYVTVGGKDYKVKKFRSRVQWPSGTKIKHVYTYEAKRKGSKSIPVSRFLEEPTRKKIKSDGGKRAKAIFARPGMYAWKIRIRRRGTRKIFRVIGHMTEYRIHKEFTMPRGAKKATYFGRSTYTPP